MNKSEIKTLIEVASGRVKADLLIKNCKVVDVYNSKIIEGDVAISGRYIAGIGNYESDNIVDAENKYLVPGLIDSHIHIESSYLSPEELGKILIPHGTSTIIADPHEIVNVCGLKGFEYMREASKSTALSIKYMVPSCVPATPFETTGACMMAEDMIEPINQDGVLGLGEFMNYPGIIYNDDETIDKLCVAYESNKIIDGHSPGVFGKELNAYISAGIKTDHECATSDEARDRLERGMYVLLRKGSACHDLRNLIPVVTPQNSRRCLLCSDDRHPKTILEIGHLEEHLKTCVEMGIDPITAIQMASLNAAECYRLDDRGAIAPGKLASFSIMKDLKDFEVEKMFVEGQLVASDGEYLLESDKYPIDSVSDTMHVNDFDISKFKIKLKTNRANIIQLMPGGVVTKKVIKEVSVDENNEFIFDKNIDVCKVAVIERHKNTGNFAVGLLSGYQIQKGAIAQSVAHDSHNIIVVGTNDEDMLYAAQKLIEQKGGVILVDDEEVIESLPMPIGGLMSDKSGEWVAEKLTKINEKAFGVLKINKEYEPIMTLGFMSLAVIPEIKLTDRGLFDVTKFEYIDIDV